MANPRWDELTHDAMNCLDYGRRAIIERRERGDHRHTVLESVLNRDTDSTSPRAHRGDIANEETRRDTSAKREKLRSRDLRSGQELRQGQNEKLAWR